LTPRRLKFFLTPSKKLEADIVGYQSHPHAKTWRDRGWVHFELYQDVFGGSRATDSNLVRTGRLPTGPTRRRITLEALEDKSA